MSQAIQTTEPVLLESKGGYIKGKLSVELGRFELTARRLRFHQWSKWYRMFGLIGALLAMRSKGTVTLDLDLGAITKLARGKYGLNKKVLDVTMGDGATYRLMFDKYDDLSARVRDAIGQHGKQVVASGEEVWTVNAA